MTTFSKIMKALEEHGPMSARDLAEETGVKLQNVQGSFGWIRAERPGTIYIHSWRHELTATRLNLNAVYALGDQPDAKRPKPMTSAQKCKRWRQKHKRQVASVFDMAAKMDRRVFRKEAARHLNQG